MYIALDKFRLRVAVHHGVFFAVAYAGLQFVRIAYGLLKIKMAFEVHSKVI